MFHCSIELEGKEKNRSKRESEGKEKNRSKKKKSGTQRESSDVVKVVRLVEEDETENEN